MGGGAGEGGSGQKTRGLIGQGEVLEFQVQWEAIGGFGTEDGPPPVHRI